MGSPYRLASLLAAREIFNPAIYGYGGVSVYHGEVKRRRVIPAKLVLSGLW